jgi:hypothetical protein
MKHGAQEEHLTQSETTVTMYFCCLFEFNWLNFASYNQWLVQNWGNKSFGVFAIKIQNVVQNTIYPNQKKMAANIFCYWDPTGNFAS